ncbi:MAG: NADH-quinone oxidoreductase subunit N [Pirellulales bacterium]|nr:NADH-quinone oxidoreductase subunit N [Pirellulales bacterium]
MSLSQLLNSIVGNTTDSVLLFRPELVLCATIVLMLLVRVFHGGERIHAFWIALIGSAVGFWFSIPWNQLAALGGMDRVELFTGMLVYDSFTIFFRAILLLFAVLFVIFTRISGIPAKEDATDFYSLVLGATLGMCIMASANHLLTIFLGVEMASVPSYALVGILKGQPKSSEAALKYSVYGAGAAGVMLYGISLLAGVLGTCHLPTMADRMADAIAGGQLADRAMVLALGGLMIGVGLAFKLSAFPFHFWCPDVFEGACAEVNAFLSVASKAAALALLIRVAVGFGSVHSEPRTMPVASAAAIHETAANVPAAKVNISTVSAVKPAAVQANSVSTADRSRALEPVRRYLALLIAVIAAVTCTFGNLAAYGQTNIKRLMAYSTIAHAGYMMMPVAAGVALSGSDTAAAAHAFAAIPFYVGLYLFMNLGAFAIIAFLRNAMRSEEIDHYGGLMRVAPGVVVCFAVILFSLVGLPPLAGFSAKYVAFAALVSAMSAPGYSGLMLALLVIGGLNTAVSLFYYLRVVKAMTIDPESDTRPAVGFSLVSVRGAFVALVTLPVLILGLFWNQFYAWLTSGAANLL